MRIFFLSVLVFVILSYLVHRYVNNEDDFETFPVPEEELATGSPNNLDEKSKNNAGQKTDYSREKLNVLRTKEFDEIQRLFSKEKYKEIQKQIENKKEILLAGSELQKYYFIAGYTFFKNYKFDKGLDLTTTCINFPEAEFSQEEEDVGKMVKGLCFLSSSEINYVMRRYEKAFVDANNAMGFNPMNLNDHRGKCMYYRGIAEVKLKQYQKGLDDLMQSMNLFPKIIKLEHFKSSVAEAKAKLKTN